MAEPDVNHTKRISTQNAGNGLAASQILPAGSLIIKISSPHLILLEKAALESTCSWCFRKPEPNNMQRCSTCKVVRYCTKECQKKDWNSVHKKECKIINESVHDVWPTPVRALIQLMLKHQYGYEPDPKWLGLVMNQEQTMKDKQRYDMICLQALAAVKFANKIEGPGWMEMAPKLLCQMTANAFRVTMPDDTPIGLCFEPTLALANHSCSPNAVVVFDGRAVTARALMEIKSDQEVFISYVDCTQTTPKRQQELQHQYFFTCKCPKCSGGEVSYQSFLRQQKEIFMISSRLMYKIDTPAELIQRAKDSLIEYQRLLNHDRNIGPLLKSNEPQEQLDRILFNTNIDTTMKLFQLQNSTIGTDVGLPALEPYPIIIQNIYLCLLDNEAWIPALVFLLHLAINTDPFVYPIPHHPVRVVRYFTIFKLVKHISTFSPPEMIGELQKLDIKVAESIMPTLLKVNFGDILQFLIAIVSEEVGRSHGAGTRFAREVEGEARKISRERKRSGNVRGVEALERYFTNGNDREGEKAVQGAVESLWRLSAFVTDLLSVPLFS